MTLFGKLIFFFLLHLKLVCLLDMQMPPSLHCYDQRRSCS